MSKFRDLISIIKEAESTVSSDSSPKTTPVKRAQLNEEQLTEGRHDDLIKQAIDSLTIKVGDDENLLRIITTFSEAWKKLRSQPGFKNLNNKWKYFLSDATRNAMINSVIKNGLDDPKIANKVKMRNIDDPREVIDLFDNLVHFSGIQYQPIQAYDPNSSPDTVIDDLLHLEQEWKSFTEEWVEVDGTEEMIIDLGELKWFDLHRPYCDLEGDAMGHCGNAGYSSDETILSLRRVMVNDGVTYHRPSLTFILDGEKMLGETKGRGNDKPSPKYHKHILALLKSEYVDGVKGGGYKPENNFSITDLPEEHREELINAKGEDFLLTPDIRVVKKAIEQFKANELTSKEFSLKVNGVLNDLDDTDDKEIPQLFISSESFTADRIPIDIEEIVDLIGDYKKYMTGDEFVDVWGESVDIDYILSFASTEALEQLYKHLLEVHSDAIIDNFMLEDDELDITYIKDNIESIIVEVVDSFETDLNSASNRATEVAILDEIGRKCTQHITDMLSKLSLEIGNYSDIYDDMVAYISIDGLIEFIESLKTADEDNFTEIEDINTSDAYADDELLKHEVDDAIDQFIESNQ